MLGGLGEEHGEDREQLAHEALLDEPADKDAEEDGRRLHPGQNEAGNQRLEKKKRKKRTQWRRERGVGGSGVSHGRVMSESWSGPWSESRGGSWSESWSESWEDVTWSGSGEAHSRIVAGTAYDPGTASRGVNGEFSPRIHGRNSWIPEDAASGEPGRNVGLQDVNFQGGDTDSPFTTPSITEISHGA